MRTFRKLWFLALAAMLLTAFAPQALASWVCEGRTCGISLWFCCCEAPEGSQDSNCGNADPVSADLGSLNCPSECNCTLTVTSADQGRLAPAGAATLLVHAPATLPQTTSPAVITPSEVSARLREDRGPPAPKVCLATPILRGPPSLTFTSIGS